MKTVNNWRKFVPTQFWFGIVWSNLTLDNVWTTLPLFCYFYFCVNHDLKLPMSTIGHANNSKIMYCGIFLNTLYFFDVLLIINDTYMQNVYFISIL
mgnify:FL=1